MREYVEALALYRGDFYKFVEAAKRMKKSFLLLQFIMISLILFLPLFYSVARLEPYELYSRMYGISIDSEVNLGVLGGIILEGGNIRGEPSTDIGNSYDNSERIRREPTEDVPGILVNTHFGEGELDGLDKAELWFCFSDDVVAICNNGNIITLPMSAYGDVELGERRLVDIFNDVAINNNYFGSLLIPALGLILLVLMALQIVFYLILNVVFGTFRMVSSRMSFFEKMSVLLLSSTPMAVVSMLVGFAIPTFHIIVFELAAISFAVYISKKYDKREREVLLCEE